MPDGGADTSARSLHTSVPLWCFLLSGVAGLLYEVCWIRRAALVFGSTVHASSVVFAVFFAGIALGSAVVGRQAKRIADPLKLYARLELGLAFLGAASLPLFHVADLGHGAAYRLLGDGNPLLWPARIVLVALVLLGPTFVMGSTLPLFAQAFVPRAGRISGSIGFLYGLNTLGAALGCALAGAVLLPEIGVTATVALAALLNALAGLLSLRFRTEPPPAPQLQDRGLPTRTPSRLLLLLVFLTGLAAVGQEVLWTRFLALIVRNTVYTYTLTLSVILCGIVVGSWLASWLFRRTTSRAAIFGALQIALALGVQGIMLLPAHVWHGIAHGYAAYFLLLLGPAILSGASFPLAVQLLTDDPQDAGDAVGRVTALNTLGGIVGSLLTGFVLLPQIGMHGSTILLTAVNLVAGLLAWVALSHTWTRPRRLLASGVAVLLFLATPQLSGTHLPDAFLGNSGKLVETREGLQANLAVVQRGGVMNLEMDRWWQGQDKKTHQIVAAHLPMLLHPEPRRVLVVGVGAGQTPARFLQYESLEALDCVDVEPGVFALIAKWFEHAWMNDPRVRLIAADGRNYLQHTDQAYDLISQEVGQVFRPGVPALYTQEFYRYARGRLAPNGLFSQFVPLAFLPTDAFRGIVRTFLTVFPNSVLWYNKSELLLIGSVGPSLFLDPQRLLTMQRNPQVNADLRFSYWGGEREWLNQPAWLLGGFLLGPDGLDKLAGDARTDVDDRPELEYTAAFLGDASAYEAANLALIRQHLTPMPQIARGLSDDVTAAAAQVRTQNLVALEAGTWLHRAEHFQQTGQLDVLVNRLRALLAVSPNHAEANRVLGDTLLILNRPTEAEPYEQHAADLLPTAPLPQRGLGLAQAQRGKWQDAVAHLRQALALGGDDPELRLQLVAALCGAHAWREAADELQRVVNVRPQDVALAHRLATLRQKAQAVL